MQSFHLLNNLKNTMILNKVEKDKVNTNKIIKRCEEKENYMIFCYLPI